MNNVNKWAAAIVFAAVAASPIATHATEDKENGIPELSNSLAGNYLAARIAARDKDTESASQFYERALSLDPDNTNLQFQTFLNSVANGNFVKGVGLGSAVAKQEAAPEIVGLILAVDDIRKKAWKNAERRLDKSWRSALDRLMSGLVLSWVKFGQNQPKEALAAIDKLSGPAWFDLFVQYHGGLIALASGDSKEAVRRLGTAYANRAGGQAARDTYMRVIGALAQAHWKAGEKDKAKSLIKNGLDRAPQNPVLEAMQANVLADKAPGIVPLSTQRGAAEVFLNLGTAVDKEGGEQFARIYLQLAAALADKDPEIVMQLGELYDKQGKLTRANALFEKIGKESPLYQIARLEIALNLDELEQLDEARAQMDKLIERNPDALVTYLSYGAVLARHEKYDDAIGIYQKIIDRIGEPKRFHWNLFYRQGIAYERTKKWPMAEAAFKKALELYPDQPNVLNYLGYSWVDQNINLQEGLDMIRKAVDLRPNDGYIVDSLGWAYFRLKRYQEAVVELERAVELRPGDPTINDHLGDAYWRANRKLEATFQWQHALALKPDEEAVERIEAKLEKGLDAVEKQEAASEEKPDNG